ncbi:unnamed protein product [Porites lobata]|uniref:Tetratricopeptide repeat protein n=1 Tax=Porites lobata TaxID=104759 RepID=A0ABN8SDU2_9CNID|nr:unnamed protein product [Porites lobata]
MRPVKEQKRILRKLTGFRMTWKSPLVIAGLSVSQTWPMSRETTRSRGKPKIKETIRIRLNDYSDEDICRVMLGATYNDMAVAPSLEEDQRRAIKIREEKTLQSYTEKLGEHPFTVTIYNNISNNFRALGEFDQAKPYSEHALKIRRKLLNDHMDTAKSLFDLGMVHKKKGGLQQAITYL